MKAKKITLRNGLRILLVPQRGSVATTVLILVSAGSEYEKKNISGISHFLEHMVFKGTVSRPEPGMIAEELDALGAEYNAFTSREYTGYWAKAEARRTGKLLDIVSDLYLNPVLDPAEIEKEKGVIIEEINMYEDMPMRSVWDVFTTLLYGDTSAGWNIAGTKRTVRGLKKETLAHYRDASYVPSGTVLVVSGRFSESDIRKKAEKLFGSFSRKRGIRKPRTRYAQKSPRAVVQYKKSDQSHIVLGARAFSVSDSRRDTLELLAHILGGGMSSRLFRRIREEMGAAYYVGARAMCYLDHGFLAVSAGANHPRTDEVIYAILEECSRLTREIVSPGELRRAKDHLIGTSLINLETSDELASFYAEQEILLGKAVSPEVLMKKIDGVSADAIRRVARQVFRDPGLNLAVVGPYRSPAHFRHMLRF